MWKKSNVSVSNTTNCVINVDENKVGYVDASDPCHWAVGVTWEATIAFSHEKKANYGFGGAEGS